MLIVCTSSDGVCDRGDVTLTFFFLVLLSCLLITFRFLNWTSIPGPFLFGRERVAVSSGAGAEDQTAGWRLLKVERCVRACGVHGGGGGM